jgi:hypothetical protein
MSASTTSVALSVVLAASLLPFLHTLQLSYNAGTLPSFGEAWTALRAPCWLLLLVAVVSYKMNGRGQPEEEEEEDEDEDKIKGRTLADKDQIAERMMQRNIIG